MLSEKEFQDDVRLIANRVGGSYCEMLIMKHKIVVEATRTHYEKEIKILRDALKMAKFSMNYFMEKIPVNDLVTRDLMQIEVERYGSALGQNSTESTDAGAEVNHE